PIKQLMGIWELDSKALDVALKAGTENALNSLGVSGFINESVCFVTQTRLNVCPAFIEKDSQFVKSSTSQTRSKFVCSRCFNNEGGHFFQRRKKNTPQFSCIEKHANDNQRSLYLLGRWIQEMSTDQDQELQAMLLEEVWSGVVKFLDKKTSTSKNSKDNNNSVDTEQTIQTHPPTYFSIRAALRIKK
ncbi:4428_t:CDS:2, partial [Racocetra persica]